MRITESMHTCSMCGGKFPGPGIEEEGKLYCCDRCADFGQHKTHMLAAMAPKVAGVLALGLVAGFVLSRGTRNWLSGS
ncbi:MAG: hypothetical protein IV085_08080 [Thiobacillus sp.]|nr:hypothetical protein [Thiobacillus sp.]